MKMQKAIAKLMGSNLTILMQSNLYSCVEFGRLGCTSFIIIKEVPFL